MTSKPPVSKPKARRRDVVSQSYGLEIGRFQTSQVVLLKSHKPGQTLSVQMKDTGQKSVTSAPPLH